MFLRLRQFLRKPVAWGAVLLSYIGIIAAVSYAAAMGAAGSAALDQEAKDSRAAIVASGQVAIKSACVFDNKRARELRAIMEASKKQLAAYEREGFLSHAQVVRASRSTDRAIKKITLRNCEKEAQVLTAEPEDAPRNRFKREKNQ